MREGSGHLRRVSLPWEDRPRMGERLDQYFRGLPDGWDSFPEFRAKASLIRTALEVRPAPTSLEAIPEPLRAYFEAPPLPSAWIPEVHYLAFGVAVADVEGFSDEDVRRVMVDNITELTTLGVRP